jgi:signal transduction histidine kinase
VLLAYQVGLAALAAALLAGIIYAPWERVAIGELVAELGDVRSGPMRDALARALGDPSLQLGYWLPEQAAYVDARGHPIDLPPVASNRSVMRIDRGGQAVAVLVHDPVVLDDPELEEAVASVARLAAANARLETEVRGQLTELEASRLRLLRSGDAERRRLEERLRDGAERRLLELRSTLVCAHARAASGSEAEVRIGHANDHLTDTLAELRELARGLHPRALRDLGLAGALAALAEQSPVPVELALSCDDLSEEVGVAVYFVCSEALSNAAKYASASLVTVRVVATALRVEVEVSDVGSGGADAARGSGLRGLSDRVESLGGTLRINSRPGHGTAVFAVLPRTHPRPTVR